MPGELEKQIDVNNNNWIELKEVLSFLGKEDNVKQLGAYLTNIGHQRYDDNLYGAVQRLLPTYTYDIYKKAKNNQGLSSTELSKHGKTNLSFTKTA